MSTLANHVIAQVVLYNDSGLIEDAVTNTFHFKKPNAVAYSTAAPTIATVLTNFYDTVPAGAGAKVSSYLSNCLKTGTNQAEIKTYDGSIPPGSRVPDVTTFTLGAPAGSTDAPNEVAFCVSFKAQEVGVAPFSHQRGRVYLGPLSTSAFNNTTAGSRPNSTLMVDAAYAAVELQQSIAALGTGYDWCVYSPTSNMLFPISQIWVDDSWDTQRRRGVKATTRTTYNV